jgi:hypothetical protein
MNRYNYSPREQVVAGLNCMVVAYWPQVYKLLNKYIINNYNYCSLFYVKYYSKLFIEITHLS